MRFQNLTDLPNGCLVAHTTTDMFEIEEEKGVFRTEELAFSRYKYDYLHRSYTFFIRTTRLRFGKKLRTM